MIRFAAYLKKQVSAKAEAFSCTSNKMKDTIRNLMRNQDLMRRATQSKQQIQRLYEDCKPLSVPESTSWKEDTRIIM